MKHEFIWKKTYTLVLILNALYILSFYLIMTAYL